MRRMLTTVGMALMVAASLLVPNPVWHAPDAGAANDVPPASVISFGRAGDQTVAGRWRSSDKTDGIGTFVNGVWSLRSDLRRDRGERFQLWASRGHGGHGRLGRRGTDGVGTFLDGSGTCATALMGVPLTWWCPTGTQATRS